MNRRLKAKISKRKHYGPTREEVKDYLKKLKTVTPALINFVLGKRKRPTQKWTSGEIMEALVLRKMAGTKAYEHLRSHHMCPLPGVTTLRRHISHFRVTRGLLHSGLDIVKQHLQGEKRKAHRTACLSFDEVAISGEISYDEREKCFLPSASKLQVVMIRGLFKPFKVPIYAEFDQPMKKEILFEQIIKAAEEVGAEIVSQVSDMAPDNQTLLRELGVTYEKPFYVHPLDPSRKIFAFADPPHLIKRFR